MADRLNGIIFSEILADNAGGNATDVDGDGSANKADEFVEIQNTTGSAISLDGYEIWSEKGGLLYSFGATDTIGAGGTATVVGEYTGTPPAGFYSATSNNSINWLPDGEGQKFDSLFLVDTNTGDYVVLSYGNPPRTPTEPSGFPGTNQVGAGEQIDSNAPNGVAFSRDGNGDFVENPTPTPGTPGTPCFCPGTLIETVDGPVAVEDLRPGQALITYDGGTSRLLAVRRYEISAKQTRWHPHLMPVRLPAGFMGSTHPLDISPNHCVMIKGPEVSLLFGESEVLVAAKQLLPFGAEHLGHAGQPLVYYHLLLEDHVILRAHGLWTESLFLGEMVAGAEYGLTEWEAATGVCPDSIRHETTARPVLHRYEAQLLMQTLTANALPLAA